MKTMFGRSLCLECNGNCSKDDAVARDAKAIHAYVTVHFMPDTMSTTAIQCLLDERITLPRMTM